MAPRANERTSLLKGPSSSSATVEQQSSFAPVRAVLSCTAALVMTLVAAALLVAASLQAADLSAWLATPSPGWSSRACR